MKQTKLNNAGFSHDLLIVAIVAVTAVVGVGYMVGTKANQNSDVLGTAVSAPKNKKAPYCDIKNVPKRPTHEKYLNPTLVITNKSKEPIKPEVTTYLAVYLKDGQPPIVTSNSYPPQVGEIAPKGKASIKMFTPFTVPYKSAEKGFRGVYIAESKNPSFSCSAKFTFPKKPKQKSSTSSPEYGPVIVAPAGGG